MYDVNKWQELYQPHTDYQISKFNVTDLPDKYNIDLNRLDEGIKNTLQNFQIHNFVNLLEKMYQPLFIQMMMISFIKKLFLK